MRRHLDDESVDLVYLDPPFKSDRDYNVLFAERDGTQAAAQIKAFEDTWTWDQNAAKAYEEVVEAGGHLLKLLATSGDRREGAKNHKHSMNLEHEREVSRISSIFLRRIIGSSLTTSALSRHTFSV